MRILISGSSGFIGSAILPFISSAGHQTIRLVRPSSKPMSGLAGEIPWDPSNGTLEASKVEGFDAVINLAGENIGARRWTETQKRKLIESRVLGTQLLSQTISRLQSPPKVFISASAVGYYGGHGEEWLDESSPAGEGFLAELAKQWEAAAAGAVNRGVRVVQMRLGVVLASWGGALAKMLTPFRFGLGGRIGSGRQYLSWIAMDDVSGAIRHILDRQDISGAVNVTSPNPVTNSEFTKTLGRVISRPTLAPMPAFAARLALGEMADDLLLKGARVRPSKLLDSRYLFLYPSLEGALRFLLGKD